MARRGRRSLPTTVYLDPKRLETLRRVAKDRKITQGEVLKLAFDAFVGPAKRGRRGRRPARPSTSTGGAPETPRDQVPAAAAAAPTTMAEALGHLRRVVARAQATGAAATTAATSPTTAPYLLWRPPGRPGPPPAGERPPLAFTYEGEALEVAPGACGWRVLRKLAAGIASPVAPVRVGARPLVLDLHAPFAWLAAALGQREGGYWLVPVDERGDELGGPRAFVLCSVRGPCTEADLYP